MVRSGAFVYFFLLIRYSRTVFNTGAKAIATSMYLSILIVTGVG